MQTKPVWEYIDLGMKLGVEQFFMEYLSFMNDSNVVWDGMEAANEVKFKIGLSYEDWDRTLKELDLLGARGVVGYMSPRTESGTGASAWAELLASVVKSESERIQVFAVTKKRYDTKDLLNNVSAIFGQQVFASLHDVAQSDFNDAGKCIAFDLPTSAAFHLMRGTEMVLRQLYRAKIGKDAGEKNWGPMVKDLQAKDPTLKPLYDHLDNIRENFRNPTQHPDKIYGIDEAQDLFGVCVDVVDQMIPIIMQLQEKIPE